MGGAPGGAGPRGAYRGLGAGVRVTTGTCCDRHSEHAARSTYTMADVLEDVALGQVQSGAKLDAVDRRLHASSRTVWLNGKFVPEHEARVSIFDEALMYGSMAFEMTRTYGGKPFCLHEHLVRLYASLKMMKIDPKMTIDEMEALTLEVLETNRSTEASDVDWQIMHDVSRGTMGLYQSIGEGGDNDGGPTVSINCWPLITHQGSYAPNYTTGVDLVVSPVQQLPAHLLDLKAKTRSRLHYKMAELAAQPLVRDCLPISAVR